MIYIGTAAYCGSGQDTLADEICRLYNFQKYSIGDYFKQLAYERNVIPTRENLQKIRIEIDEYHNRDFIPIQISDYLLTLNKNTIITGLRTTNELNIFRNKLNLYFIFVFADKDIRYQRILNRNDTKDPKTLADIIRQEKIELDLFDIQTLEDRCDFKFIFNQTLDEFILKSTDLINEIPIMSKLANTSY